MADKRISQLIERVDIANNDVLPIVASGATTTNKVTISTIQDWMQGHLDLGVTSVGITLGSSGTDVNVTGSPITTSGNITINIPTASATNRGLLSASDWSTFNAKQPAGNYVTLDTTQTITAHKTFTASGGQNSITINHSSGAGHGLEITKAGNGEGIRVNKTSGSGNAATIIGTLEATTIVKTGGTSSQFLKADGSVDSSTYVTTDTTQTITGSKTFSGSSLRLAANGTADAVVLRNVSGTTGSDTGATTIGFNGNDNIFVNTQSNGGFILAFSNTVSNRQYDLPNASGTIALTSNLSSYLPLSGGTLTGALNGTSANFNDTITASKSSAGASVTVSNTGSNAQLQFSNSTHQSQIGIANLGAGAAANTFYINTSSGAIGSGITMNNSGAVTLAGALSGTSASFSGNVSSSRILLGGASANSYRINLSANSDTDTAGILMTDTNIGGRSYSIGSSITTIGNLEFRDNTAGANRLTISSTGAATFSSSVTAASGIFSGGGRVLQVTSTNDAVPASIISTQGAISTLGFKGTTTPNEFNVRIGADGNDMVLFTSNTIQQRISSTGAATFSSSVTAGAATFSGTAGNQTPFFTLNATSANETFNWVSRAYASNLSAGNNLVHFIGQSASNKNSAYLGFKYAGSGSNDNILTLGLFGVDNVLNINGSGNVGIGTASPLAKLVVATANNSIEFNEVTSTTAYLETLNAGRTSSNFFSIYTRGLNVFTRSIGGNYVQNFVVTDSGNVGIGITPQTWWGSRRALEIFGGGAFTGVNAGWMETWGNSYLDGAATTRYLQNGVAGLYQVGNLSGGVHEFLVAPSGTAGNAASFTTAMRITSGGNVLVNTTSLPSSTTKGFGIGVDASGTYIQNRVDTTANYGQLAFFNPNGLVGSINTSGSSTSYNTSSDYRLKENVKPVEGALSKLEELKPCTFNYIADAEEEIMGFLAHEVQEVIPQAVTGEKDAVRIEEVEVSPAILDEEGNVITEAVIEEKEVPVYQGIDHSKLVPLLVAAIQELKAEVEALKSQING